MIPLDKNPLYALSMDAYNYCLKEAFPKIAIDCGANEGGYTQSMVDSGFHVTAFEPVPDMFCKLVSRFRTNPNVKCCCNGVSDRNGIVQDITVLCAWTLGNEGDGGMSVCPSYKGTPKFDVSMVALDSLAWPRGVGFVKLDVDGYEKKALIGMRNLLIKYAPPILCEFSAYIPKLGDSAESFVNLIIDLGYDIFSMDGKRRFNKWTEIEPCYPFDTSFDVMLIPKKMSDKVLAHFNA